jgi:hypothetical protein
MFSSYFETTLHIRVTIHVSVRTSRGSREQLTADETLAQSVTTDNKDLADQVGIDGAYISLRSFSASHLGANVHLGWLGANWNRES